MFISAGTTTSNSKAPFHFGTRPLRPNSWRPCVKWLGEFDRIRKEVEQQFDVRSSTLSLLISVGLEAERLSKNIRAKFADKVEPELFDFIEARLPSAA